MIFIQITGGLGNQMFQYAFGRALANKHKTELILDCSFYKDEKKFPKATKRSFELDNFKINARLLDQCNFGVKFIYSSILLLRKITHILGINRYSSHFFLVENQAFKFDAYINSSRFCVLSGYWQSENYFKKSESLIKNEFQLISELKGKELKLSSRIQSCNSVSIHIRRGDYANDKSTNLTHGTCSIDYYLSAINFLSTIVANPIFFIFSDDIEWVKSNLRIEFPHEFVEGDLERKSHFDLYLMSLCKYNIIANSTFSWWAAWLNSNNQKIVIAPQKWYSDSNLYFKAAQLIPKEWKTL